ncbi:MAG TPA: hypothetical protein VM409_04035 [Chloroflexia bacterium]|nr:hypothetical protein [Chloroflexia bacterium]
MAAGCTGGDHAGGVGIEVCAGASGVYGWKAEGADVDASAEPVGPVVPAVEEGGTNAGVPLEGGITDAPQFEQKR